MRRLIVAATVVALAGCATKYQANSFWLGGGFTETQLDANVYRVSFHGNEFTSPERTQELVLLRSAELAIKNDFSHFAIVDANTRQNVSSFTTPVQSTTTGTVNSFGNSANLKATTTTTGGQTFVTVSPSSTNTVVFFKSRPNVQGMVYSAEFLCNSLGRKYEVRCGAN